MTDRRVRTHLIIQSYPEKNVDRMNELIDTLQKNLENKCIDLIHDIQEFGTVLPKIITDNKKMVITEIDTTKTKHNTHISQRIIGLLKRNKCNGKAISVIKERIKSPDFNYNEEIKQFDQLLEGNLKNRMTYKYAFNYARDNIPMGDIVIIANNDIIIEDSDNWYNIDRDLFSIDPMIGCCITRSMLLT